MNILIVVSSLTGGGAERVAASWANGLVKLNNNVSVMTDYSKPVTYKLNANVNQISFPISSNNFIAKKILDPIRKIRLYRRIIIEYNINAILTVLHISPIAIKLALVGLKNKPKFILTDHNAYERPSYAPMSGMQRFNKYYLNRIYDYITVLTNRDKEILNHRGYNNVIALHNPLFLTPVNITPKKDKIILAVGRMDVWEYKGFDLLIRAWNKIYIKHPDWRLRIVGEASSETLNFLKGLSENNHSIEFVRYTPNISKEYERASIFVLSSRYEGWGLVLVEAMSQACACIACDYNGRQAEIIQDYQNGLLIKPDNVDELSIAIQKLINDSNLREQFQKNAPKSVRRFSEIKTAQTWMRILKGKQANKQKP